MIGKELATLSLMCLVSAGVQCMMGDTALVFASIAMMAFLAHASMLAE